LLDGELQLHAVVADPDGGKVLREVRQGSDPIALGNSVADALLRQGGDEILRKVYGREAAIPQQP